MESAWLREAVRLSFSTIIDTSTIEDGHGTDPPQPKVPVLRKLVEGLLYSRRFILTYHLVIFAFVLLLSAIHWSGKAFRWKKRRILRLQILAADDAYDGEVIKPVSITDAITDANYESSSSSSGSSTLEGSASPPTKDVNEETSLLINHQSSQSGSPWGLINYVKSFLMYQPAPIPFFNKTLPSNGTSVVIIALIALNIFYTLYHINFNVVELFVVADRCGLIFAANLPLLYLLAAKNQPLRTLTGSSYESLNIFHRRLGELLCLEALLHTLGMLGVWYTLFRPNHFSFKQFLLEKVVILGIGAFASYEIMYFTSLASFRQRWYELFLSMHIVLQTSGLAFLFFHHPQSRIYVGSALAIFLVDRLVYRLGMKSVTVEASVIVMEDGETVKLSTFISKHTPGVLSQIMGPSIKDGWKATDHVFVTIPALGKTHMLQAHPFTIASAAPPSGFDETHLDLLIRAQDGFSRHLLEKAQRVSSLTLRLDGPYGSPHARNLLVDSELAFVVAGGSGIAVAWPLIHHLLDISRSTDTEIAPTSALRRQKIVLIWVVHKAAHVEWVGTKTLAEVANMGVEIVVPLATEDVGRPDLRSMIRDTVELWHKGGSREGKKVGVVASGPDSMGRLVRNTCSELVREGRNVNVTIEKFGW